MSGSPNVRVSPKLQELQEAARIESPPRLHPPSGLALFLGCALVTLLMLISTAG